MEGHDRYHGPGPGPAGTRESQDQRGPLPGESFDQRYGRFPADATVAEERHPGPLGTGQAGKQLRSGGALDHQFREGPRTWIRRPAGVEIDDKGRAHRGGGQADRSDHRQHMVEFGVKADDGGPAGSHAANVWAARPQSNPLSNVTGYVISGGFRRLDSVSPIPGIWSQVMQFQGMQFQAMQ
jgi:hypothetical protein